MMEEQQKKKNTRGGSETMFPGRLHDLLEYVEEQGLDNIVSWVNGGTAFMVHKPDEFIRLLSFFFGQSKYRSFTRQLNMWYFERESFGVFKGAWHHPYFKKHHKGLCARMSRHEAPRRELPRLEIVDSHIHSLSSARFHSQKVSLSDYRKQQASWSPPAFPSAACMAKEEQGVVNPEQQQQLPPLLCGSNFHSETPQHGSPLSNQQEFTFHNFSSERRQQALSFPSIMDYQSQPSCSTYSPAATAPHDMFTTMTHHPQHWQVDELATQFACSVSQEENQETIAYRHQAQEEKKTPPFLPDRHFLLGGEQGSSQNKHHNHNNLTHLSYHVGVGSSSANSSSTSNRQTEATSRFGPTLEDFIGDDEGMYLLNLLQNNP